MDPQTLVKLTDKRYSKLLKLVQIDLKTFLKINLKFVKIDPQTLVKLTLKHYSKFLKISQNLITNLTQVHPEMLLRVT